MINCNGTIVSSESNVLQNNRSFLFGDGVFETVKILHNKILFLEDHYFRLMAAMRVVRMDIPMNFTMEYFENQILLVAKANNCSSSARARITFYRNPGGAYLPETNSVSYLINAVTLENETYSIKKAFYEVDLYKDFYISKQLLSSIKTTNKIINVVGSIYAKENDLDNCLLLNDSKNIVEALQGNIFMLMGNTLITPPVSEGCLNGIMRKKIIELAKTIETVSVVEQVISPFDLQKAEELFVTNVILGIQPITKYRKKEYKVVLANKLLEQLNAFIRLN